jgi:heptosyltransferase-2
MRNPPPFPSGIKRLAVIFPSWVGDTVMATPVLRAIRLRLPETHVVGVMRQGFDELLAGSGWIDQAIVEDTKTLAGTVRAARRLRAAAVEGALLLPNTVRSALVARLGASRRRIGYLRWGRSPLLTHALQPPPGRPPVSTRDYYAALGAWALGAEQIEPGLELAVTETQHAEAETMLAGVSRPFAMLCPGANKPPKRWPADRFAAVADHLTEDHGLAVVATGSPAEQDIVGEVSRAATTEVHDLADRGVTLGGLKAVIAEAGVMITNDTGPRHIAAAVGTPVVTLFGPTDPRWTTIGFARERALVAEPFLPAELVADDHPHQCAITRIPVGDVLAAVEQLLAVSSPAARAGRAASRGSTPEA